MLYLWTKRKNEISRYFNGNANYANYCLMWRNGSDPGGATWTISEVITDQNFAVKGYLFQHRPRPARDAKRVSILVFSGKKGTFFRMYMSAFWCVFVKLGVLFRPFWPFEHSFNIFCCNCTLLLIVLLIHNAI